MKSRIIITDEIVTDALSMGKTVTDVLAAKYEGEIADRIKADERLKNKDAFQLALMDAGIGKRSVVAEFYRTDNNEWLFPVFIDRRLHESVAAMNILPFLVSGVEPVSSNSIRGAKLNMDADNLDATRKKRVAEGTDLPLAVLKIADTAYSLFKRGRALETTYEAYRHQSVALFTKQLDMIASDVSMQQVGDVIDVLIDGDGNKNPAPVVTMTGTEITNVELVKFAIAFWKKSKRPLTTILTGDGEFYEKFMLTTFNTNEVNGMIAGARFNFPQAQLSELTVLFDERVPKAGGKEQFIGLNKDYSILKYLDVGSEIREYDKNIRNQTNLATISEIAGFAKLDDNATMILRAK